MVQSAASMGTAGTLLIKNACYNEHVFSVACF